MSTFQDWKKENPDKSVNEYYAKFPQVKSTPSHQPILSQPQAIYAQKMQETKKTDIINILVSIAAILSVTLPWVDAKYFSISLIKISGLDLHEMVKFMSAFEGNETNPYLINSFYLIPGGAFLSLIGGLVKKDVIIWFGRMSNIIALGLWSYLLWDSSKEYGSFYEILGFGFYLAIICAIVYFIKLFND